MAMNFCEGIGKSNNILQHKITYVTLFINVQNNRCNNSVINGARGREDDIKAKFIFCFFCHLYSFSLILSINRYATPYYKSLDGGGKG